MKEFLFKNILRLFLNFKDYYFLMFCWYLLADYYSKGLLMISLLKIYVFFWITAQPSGFMKILSKMNFHIFYV